MENKMGPCLWPLASLTYSLLHSQLVYLSRVLSLDRHILLSRCVPNNGAWQLRMPRGLEAGGRSFPFTLCCETGLSALLGATWPWCKQIGLLRAKYVPLPIHTLKISSPLWWCLEVGPHYILTFPSKEGPLTSCAKSGAPDMCIQRPLHLPSHDSPLL